MAASTRSRPVAILALSLAASVAAAGCGAGSTETVTKRVVETVVKEHTVTVTELPGARRTHIRVLIPFMSGGSTTGYHVVRTVSGRCDGGSTVSVREDAWRCFHGNLIYTFCLVGGGKKLLCPSGPFDAEATLMKLRKALPYKFGGKGSAEDGPPWGIKLTTGQECRLIATGTIAVAGLRVSYQCEGGDTLVGDPERSTEPWTILRRRGEGTLQLTQIAEVVF